MSTDVRGSALVTAADLCRDLGLLGVRDGDCLMVHSSLASLGRVLGGAPDVIRALTRAVGDAGTLVMPGFSPAVGDPARWPAPVAAADLDRARAHVPAFDNATTPTTMGVIPETFRRWPGTLRGPHPQVSVCARGPDAAAIVAPHALDWGQAAGTPFERLTERDARLLLIGVGFNRATLLHYAESKLPNRREKVRRIPLGEGDERRWVDAPDVGDDLDTHFPAIGERFVASGRARVGRVGHAVATLVSARELVTFATAYLAQVLPPRATLVR